LPVTLLLLASSSAWASSTKLFSEVMVDITGLLLLLLLPPPRSLLFLLAGVLLKIMGFFMCGLLGVRQGSPAARFEAGMAEHGFECLHVDKSDELSEYVFARRPSPLTPLDVPRSGV